MFKEHLDLGFGNAASYKIWYVNPKCIQKTRYTLKFPLNYDPDSDDSILDAGVSSERCGINDDKAFGSLSSETISIFQNVYQYMHHCQLVERL